MYFPLQLRLTLFYAILLQGPHTFCKRGGHDLSHPRVLLNMLLYCIGSDQQFMQTNASFVSGSTTSIATNCSK